MKIIKAYPPNYVTLRRKFPIARKKGILYAWVDRIYNPSGVYVPPALLMHEGVHCVQQEELGVEKWWAQYIESDEFRFYEEALAHMAEYRTYKENPVLLRGTPLEAMLDAIADRLSGPLYGKMMDKVSCIEVLTGRKEVDGPIEEPVVSVPKDVDITAGGIIHGTA